MRAARSGNAANDVAEKRSASPAKPSASSLPANRSDSKTGNSLSGSPSRASYRYRLPSGDQASSAVAFDAAARLLGDCLYGFVPAVDRGESDEPIKRNGDIAWSFHRFANVPAALGEKTLQGNRAARRFGIAVVTEDDHSKIAARPEINFAQSILKLGE